MPLGIPRYIRLYDNRNTPKETYDCITCVFTGNYRAERNDSFWHLGMDANVAGFCQHGWSDMQIDTPTYSHLGKKIKWSDLSADCQNAIISTYKDLWNL